MDIYFEKIGFVDSKWSNLNALPIFCSDKLQSLVAVDGYDATSGNVRAITVTAAGQKWRWAGLIPKKLGNQSASQGGYVQVS